MSNTWQLQKAKNCFSEVVNEALTHGPQIITRHGEEKVVVMSIVDYKQNMPGVNSLLALLRGFPRGVTLDLARNKSTQSRDVDL